MIAAGLLAIAIVSLANLVTMATRDTVRSRASAMSTTLAEQKMEQLRSLTWAFDPNGVPVADLSSNVAAFESTGGCPASNGGAAVGLTLSPPDALTAAADGYVDYVDERGCGLGGGSTPPPGTVYTRRWSVTAVGTDAILLRVRVIPTSDRNVAAARVPGETQLAGVTTRKTP